MSTDIKTEEQKIIEGSTDPTSPFYIAGPELTPEEIKERSFDLYRLFQISQVRESALPQFDGMGYSRWNETNEMADISYLAPKKNKGDSRITSGITHEKDSSLVSFYLSMNFEGTIRVFYKNKELIDFGTTMTKLVRKSREEERYDGKRYENYRNFTAQGTSFIREQYTEMWVPNKIITGDVDPTRLDQLKWVEKGYKKISCGCESVLVDGKKVFLEDIRQRDIRKQPGVYTVEYVPREQMRTIWGKTYRWKNVPYMVTPTAVALGTLAQGSIYSDWIWGEIDYNKMEVIQVYRPYAQRYQIYLNGVPMLPGGFPLKAVSPSGLIPIAKGDADIMNMFAYSKSEPSKTKIDQAVFDEILQNMVMKQRQSAVVPRGNLSDKVVTPDMFLGGRVVSNLDPKDIPPLIENPGITQADFSFYNVFKEHIDSKSISAILEGQATGKDMTLGEYMDQQKKALLKLGGKLDGIIQWEKDMIELRTMNLLSHSYQENDDGSGYKPITMEDSMFNGTKGMNVVNFETPNLKTPEEIFDEELKYEQEHGSQIAYTYLDPKLMREALDNPDYYFCYEVVPVDKNNDTITKMTFVSMITQAANLFGIDSLQVDRLKKRYAQVMGEVYDDLFLSPEEMQIKQQEAVAQATAIGPEDGAVPSPMQPDSKQKTVDKMFA